MAELFGSAEPLFQLIGRTLIKSDPSQGLIPVSRAAIQLDSAQATMLGALDVIADLISITYIYSEASQALLNRY